MNDKEMIELTGMSIAELDTAVEVALSAEVDEYVKTIQWSDDTDQSTKTLIIGNIRGFALRTTSPKSPINHLLNRLSHDFATATAKIEALEAKLATAERLFVKCTRFDIYLGGYGDHYLYKQHDGRWYEADSEQYFDTPLEAFESLQKENTDA
jgi:ethanolamine ammonia-lyase large subunit